MMTLPTFDASVVAAARQYIGVPFEHQGRSRDGIDCVGLLQAVARDLGLKHVDSAVYSRNPSPRNLLATLVQSCIRTSGEPLELHADDIDLEDVRPGSILLHSFRARSIPRHASIVVDRERVVHACGESKIMRVIEQTLIGEMRSSVHSVWRYRWAP